MYKTTICTVTSHLQASPPSNMAVILTIRRKTLSKQSINQLFNQSIQRSVFVFALNFFKYEINYRSLVLPFQSLIEKMIFKFLSHSMVIRKGTDINGDKQKSKGEIISQPAAKTKAIETNAADN